MSLMEDEQHLYLYVFCFGMFEQLLYAYLHNYSQSSCYHKFHNTNNQYCSAFTVFYFDLSMHPFLQTWRETVWILGHRKPY